ncbi:hypothetical protein [Marinobacterium weihaiense]|uniref:Zinc-ribbon domain-containing protein n=1 Tax=Marinobacterium weihaiense TaxID=2851016 RepID=A0ABS6MF03_9GAMM|nr:hypothetical protein [Marinobacterium weihaiense]MBV0934906.1 hypothetical protein [Marinobacterium weihaiense]
MKVCKKCGKESSDASTHCSNCGSKLPSGSGRMGCLGLSLLIPALIIVPILLATPEERDANRRPAVGKQGDDYTTCFHKSIAKYQEEGQYPVLANGEQALPKIKTACRENPNLYAAYTVKPLPQDHLARCRGKGYEYYRTVGSWPHLSTGENAEKKVRELCERSNGKAFDSLLDPEAIK